MLTHVIPLRADGTKVSIEAPEDLTQRDVDRLIRFLRALPAEEPPGEFHGVSVEGGILVQADTPEELAAFIAGEIPKWQAMAKIAGVSAE